MLELKLNHVSKMGPWSAKKKVGAALCFKLFCPLCTRKCILRIFSYARYVIQRVQMSYSSRDLRWESFTMNVAKYISHA